MPKEHRFSAIDIVDTLANKYAELFQSIPLVSQEILGLHEYWEAPIL
jgi:hypothetical protein